MMLEIHNLTKRFGGLTAVKQLDMAIAPDTIVGLIGPNGAGKTTIFNLITGVFKPTRGTIRYNGKLITNKKPHVIAAMGIGRTFQLNPLFGDFNVLQNVTASFHLHPKSNLLDVYFNTKTYRRNEAMIMEEALEILELVGLTDSKNVLAKHLSHGHQKMLGIARALATKPKMLLLDEPLGGMNPDEIDHALEAINNTFHRGVTIFLVEHNMKIMNLCQHIVVTSYGEKIAEGSPEEIKKNRMVIEAYLGS